ERYDYVYVAPPQHQGMWDRAVKELDRLASKWLNPDAWVIAQLHPREYERLNLEQLMEFDQRRYGSTLLVFYAIPGE
ncbi:MAG: 16S rRNA (guanine(966)-N(2))-methyltransferase RsmD, partial [Anaerolineales bacterium]|nr:16S rRNA (guanine(966)-N(2))-methyltransferase RsmD [Anaerolineales bacterium]